MPILPVSVVVATRERHEMLAGTVRSVLAGDALPSEILVIDQSASPWSVRDRPEVPTGVALRYTQSRSRGSSRGRNLGVSQVKHDLVAILDDDVLVDPGWLSALVTALQAGGEWTVVTGRVVAGESDGHGFAPSLRENDVPERFRGRIRRDVLYGANMGAWTRTVTAVGGFDERFGPGARWPSAEDNDLAFRLLERGCEIRYVPTAAVTHLAWRPIRDVLRVRWTYGRGQGGFYAKHTRLRDTWMIRRMLGELRWNARELGRHMLRADRWSVTYAMYSAGLLVGFGDWVLAGVTRRRLP
ncbi:MAG TPA: glycosyltransferase [Miltoncostaeaceae bacterium]|nr:glycosyltransferase [Miltoncostaeaceae bacterium]